MDDLVKVKSEPFVAGLRWVLSPRLIGVAVAALLAAAVVTWPGTLTHIGSTSYLPHGFCYLWNPQLLALHVTSDAVIFLSYMAISITLATMRFRFRREVPLGWIVVAFGVFIIACGFTHLMDIIVLWKPLYWLAGDVKLVTALASATTAIALPFCVPRIIELLREAQRSKSNEQRFLAASNNSNEAFYILESVRRDGEIVDFRFAFVNPNGGRLMFSTPEELTGQLLCEALPAHRTRGFFDKFKHVVETGEPLVEEFAMDAAGLNASWLCHQVVKLDDGIAVSTGNISERKKAELQACKSLAFTESLIASSPFAVIAMEMDGTISEVNPAAERMLGYGRKELVGSASPLSLLDPDEIAHRAAELSHELGEQIAPDMSVFTAKPRRGMTDEAEWSLLRKDESRLVVQLAVTALTDPAQTITGWLGIAYDITERKQVEAYISHLAHHDALTGLPTRTLLHDRVQMALRRAKRKGTKVALLMIDLDNFKRVNDLMGHSAGDELLVQVAKRLQGAIRKSDTVARMGGDEFVVLLDDLHADDDAELVAEKLVTTLSMPVHLGEEEHAISASIGLCLYPDGGEDGDALLKNADAAMYSAKADGRNMYQVFSSNMALATTKRRLLEIALQHALAHNEFELLYQPQIAFGTGRVTGMEALLRWHSRSLGTIMPNEFIPVAEQTGLIVPIGEWVLRMACREAKALERKLGRPMTIAVNLSPRQFQRADLSQIVEQALAESGLEPERLELEITENILVSESAKAMRVLDRVRALGVRIAIDDFGTGFSSMSYILRFNVDRLKIDQSFIRNMTTDPNSCAITRAIIALAHGLKIKVVAEGVETAAVRDLLREEGCDDAQGYFFSKPVEVSELYALVQALEAGVPAAVLAEAG